MVFAAVFVIVLVAGMLTIMLAILHPAVREIALVTVLEKLLRERGLNLHMAFPGLQVNLPRYL